MHLNKIFCNINIDGIFIFDFDCVSFIFGFTSFQRGHPVIDGEFRHKFL